jgi:hypothetical protein
LKAQKFDKRAFQDDFYRWASLRSAYLAEANVDAARQYAGSGGYGPGAYAGWYGTGWYWDPWFSAYTFLPGEGIFYDPFGWAFYSPGLVWGAPYFYGRGYYGYGYHQFGPGYRPSLALGHGSEFVGHAHMASGPSGFSGGGFRGSAFAGGGGFHGGGGFGGGRR